MLQSVVPQCANAPCNTVPLVLCAGTRLISIVGAENLHIDDRQPVLPLMLLVAGVGAVECDC